MQENPEPPPDLRSVSFSALFAGVLMVLIGFWRSTVGVSDSQIYNVSVAAFYWLMRVGGIAMLIVAVLAFLNWKPILICDAAVATAIGGVMLLISLLWLANNDMVDGVLVLFFGGMFVRSGIQSWYAFCGAPARSADAAPATGQEPKAPSPGRPPLKHRVTPPKPGEPEPEGFLADLGRSKENDCDS